jgi:hypothetical protein
MNILQAVEQIRDQVNQNFFMMLVILMCWAIWTTRNDRIFKGIPPNVTRAKAVFALELKILTLRVKTKHTVEFDLWIQNLL